MRPEIGAEPAARQGTALTMHNRHHFLMTPVGRSIAAHLFARGSALPDSDSGTPACRPVGLKISAVLCVAIALTIGVAEQHNQRDILLHGGALALLLPVFAFSVIGSLSRLRLTSRPEPAYDDEPEVVATSEPLDQLLREKEAAEAANAAKSRFLASVSHEIRSPLNSIYGYAQLVERGDGIDAVEAGRIIARSAEHLTSLLDGLLDMSQVEHGVLKLGNEAFRFSAFLDQIVAMFAPMAGAKGLAFVCELPERLPEFVRSDEKRLRQILINLLSNAIKFTDSGTVQLKVGYSGQIARFEVIDTGPGISTEDQLRIFAPFVRGEAGRGRQGVGLGLVITRALTQLLGGDLQFESRPGVGTTFRVTLMLGRVAGRSQAASPRERITGYEGARRTLLVVDDDAAQLALVCKLLEAKGFDVLSATSGETALALTARQAPDLAMLDITMPGLSGWETAEALRQRFGPDLRIVMLSANAGEAQDRAGHEAPHDMFLVKPVAMDAVIDCVGRQLGLRWEMEPRPSVSGASPLKATPLPVAAQGHLDRLRELLSIGHVRGMEAEIKLLAETAPEARALTSKLLDCLDSFDLAALSAELERIGTEQNA